VWHAAVSTSVPRLVQGYHAWFAFTFISSDD
jgi:hypothetical protein